MADYAYANPPYALRASHPHPLPDRCKFCLIPDTDEDTAFDLKLVVRVGGDLLIAGRDVALGMQCPVEQRVGRIRSKTVIRRQTSEWRITLTLIRPTRYALRA